MNDDDDSLCMGCEVDEDTDNIVQALVARETELLDIVQSMAQQHCYVNRQGMVQSLNLTADYRALNLLAQYNRFYIARQHGHELTGVFK